MTTVDSYHYWHTVGLVSITIFTTVIGQYIFALFMAPIALLVLATFDWRVNPDRYETVFDDVSVETRTAHIMVHLQTVIVSLLWLIAG